MNRAIGLSLMAFLIDPAWLAAQPTCGLFPRTILESMSSANEVCNDTQNEDCHNPHFAIYRKCVGTVFSKECTFDESFQVQCSSTCWESYPQSDRECQFRPGGGGGSGGGGCFEDSGNCGSQGGIWVDCQCIGSPILVSATGNRLQMSDAAGGVDFDLDSDGRRERIAWTMEGSDDAFLALDRNGNGKIDNGGELFGNYTEQPASPERNGFLALAVFDQAEEGGNGDGWISSADEVFDRLVLWRDGNRDGVSQAGEIQCLRDSRIAGFELDYVSSWRRDRHRNIFRYIARVRLAGPGRQRKKAVDVFFTRLRLDAAEGRR